jgi:hypothetical protein
MADSGAIRLTINEDICSKLGLLERSAMTVTAAEATTRLLPTAGPVRIRFQARDCVTDAFVLPGSEEPLPGAVPMELMDLAILPGHQKLLYNPTHPDGPIY